MEALVIRSSDVIVWIAALAVLLYARGLLYSPPSRRVWAQVLRQPLPMASLVLISVYLLIALLDSVQLRLAPVMGSGMVGPSSRSLLDLLLQPLLLHVERSYSAPLALHGYAAEVEVIAGVPTWVYPRLDHAGSHLASPDNWLADVLWRITAGGLAGGVLALAAGFVLVRLTRMHEACLAWRSFLVTLALIGTLTGMLALLAPAWHPLGTDQVGNDILLQAVKSIRTGIVIGALTTAVGLPVAIALGLAAGYFRGWVDDAVQYIYTTVSSVPAVLLIAAAILSIDIWFDAHGLGATSTEQRADLRLLALCVILGLTGWTGLCRLLRAECLKLRELEFVQASRALGVGSVTLMYRHLLPNVAHLVLIAAVLDFSGLVLAEAVLAYVNIGVDSSTPSWGGMINKARGELARDPIVWWSLAAAFVFMFVLVLAANLLGDALREAWDPRLKRA
jgi:peptide/nickel transport system permease protein